MIRRRPDNDEVADLLERIADLLEAQGDNDWRVRAWRGAAGTVRALSGSLVAILDEEGPSGLVKLPGIGKSISSAIQEYAGTGKLALLDRLEAGASPENLFTTLPGIGEDLARRIHLELAVETLEDLEVAAHDGRLARVPGFGPRRVRGVKDALAAILRRSGKRRARRTRHLAPGDEGNGPVEVPPIATLLAVDADYRRGAAEGTLHKTTPRRFNPDGRAWLPVLHTDRDGWAFTATFSNTARAHELGTTHDWVLISHEREGRENLCTIVTERQGPLAGRRVVRGRERECAKHYETAGTGT